jgi:hypothetical protein
MSHFTQPEPINHNELKRLLMEITEDLMHWMQMLVTFDHHDPAASSIFVKHSEDKIRSMKHRIDNAILDGDDS